MHVLKSQPFLTIDLMKVVLPFTLCILYTRPAIFRLKLQYKLTLEGTLLLLLPLMYKNLYNITYIRVYTHIHIKILKTYIKNYYKFRVIVKVSSIIFICLSFKLFHSLMVDRKKNLP